jgi:RNA polymerase sigma-70 factor, ECF subfamily
LSPAEKTATSEVALASVELDLEQVFARSSRFVWRILARYGVRPADLPDACQDVFLVVHRRARDFDPEGSLNAWLFGICVRTAADYRKRARRRRESPSEDAPELSVPAPQQQDLEREQARRDLQRAIDALDDDQKAVFVLYELEDFSMTEIASALGVPAQTAYSRLHAARKAVTSAFRRAEALSRSPRGAR